MRAPLPFILLTLCRSPLPPAPAPLSATADAPGDKVPDKRALCLEMLSEGYVQAFVDFFYLTHRPEPEYNPDYLPHQQPKNKEIPAGDQMMIKKNLIQAEGTRRQGEEAAGHPDCSLWRTRD